MRERWILTPAIALLLALPIAEAATGQVRAPTWGPVEDVPPVAVEHGLPRAGITPDGTVVAVWEQTETIGGERGTAIWRSVRPLGGGWSEPERFPVDHIFGLSGIAVLPDGGVQIAYGWEPRFPDIKHRVRIWRADGTVGPVGLGNSADDYYLTGDAVGDTVAARLGSYDPELGFDHLVRYHDGAAWQRVPPPPASPRDVFVAGPGESVWMAGYNEHATRLVVRRWRPGADAWTVDWSRDYPPGDARRPLVEGLDLAVGGSGRAGLAVLEREVPEHGDTVYAVRRGSRGDWGQPQQLQRLAKDQGGHAATAPTVGTSPDGRSVVVGWTAPTAEQDGGTRRVLVAQREPDQPMRKRLLDTVGSFSGFRDLALSVSTRADGDVLVALVERRDDLRDTVAWLGPWDHLERTTLLRDSGGQPFGLLSPSVAAVVGTVRAQAGASDLQASVATDGP
ncbi:MAG: hypothetical protein H0U35_07070 [Sporichthyaceae bacterium]|nr:hypothetical protein [Sporichthyaceae bacterium]